MSNYEGLWDSNTNSPTYGEIYREKRMYDITIALRVYPGMSGGHPAYDGNKETMVKVNAKSLRDSLKDTKTKLYVLLDLCPQFEHIYHETFGGSNVDVEIIHIPEDTGGMNRNLHSYKRQVEVLLDREVEAPIIMLLEDDYFFLPGMDEIPQLYAEHPEIDYSTGFHHNDLDTHPYHVNFEKEYLYKVETRGRTWTTQLSTCCTYIVRTSAAIESRKYMDLYWNNYGDLGMFIALTDLSRTSLVSAARDFRQPEDKIYPLYTADQSIFSHMAHNTWQRGIDWDGEIRKVRAELGI